MNHWKGIVCMRDWSYGRNIIFFPVKRRTNGCRCTEVAEALSRSQATAAEHGPGSVTAEKPRLRAFDLARKIQQEKTQTGTKESKPPVSAHQKRVMDLKRFSQQLQNVHPNVLAKHLHRSILYQDKDYVIINKPYGVPLRGDTGVTSVTSVLDVVAKIMDGMKMASKSKLLPCLGLEKETSGTLLLARSEVVAEHVLDLRRNNKVQTKYWAITVGVPVPSEGVIDIPIIETAVKGIQPHHKMGLSPIYKMNDAGDGEIRVRKNRQAHPATTKYRVLDSTSGCSLVELQPLTGVKHQMRVHMAFALSCPILGDHKYSHWNKLAPQILPEKVLRKLGVEQSKTRYLPLHLHARQLTLLQGDEAQISVSCPLPKYFKQTLKQCYLTIPDEK
ncbi:mitochondrial RNA pseudouridine synthase rpusd4 isoform X2 [Thalassophryne amazonica]|uniref:mitochondrial RNA pseudouridine synthase rpusd4 isoform X2 n=1 Tax=Thalassophryne amazonica TaxID=390379 RepID=UPI001471419A|nr:mitochondrial RNA pseudouridine synthase rpusd4 isoform X2 [Thalassophryne amazonica]